MTPLIKVYVDDEGVIRLVAPFGRNEWDGNAYFLGYIPMDLRDHNGEEVPIEAVERRLKLAAHP